MRRTTLTAVRVDLGAVGGHLQTSEQVVSAVRACVEERTDSILIDCWVNFTGDDITILCTHERGEESPNVREILWDAFEKGATAAGEQGLYGVGQDIRDAKFSLTDRLPSPWLPVSCSKGMRTTVNPIGALRSRSVTVSSAERI